jgi:hypothetical protein
MFYSSGTSSQLFDPDDTYHTVAMSCGHSIGDFIAIGTLAWNLYKSCKAAPESFGVISLEVLSLHAVLKEAEEIVSAQPLSATKQERLKEVGDGCYCVLKDLDNLVQKYRSFGTQTKRTWERMGWGAEDIAELRARLTSNTGLLTTWIRYGRVFLVILNLVLIKNLLAYLKSVSRRNWRSFCKS